MELREAIINRRSIKNTDRHTTADDVLIQQAIELASYTPNHGMREPWRVIWIKKDRLRDYGSMFAQFAFKNDAEKQQKHVNNVSQLSGILLVVGQRDRRQKEFYEDILAIGGFMQTLSLVLHESGIGSCIKTPPVLQHPQLNQQLDIASDEMIFGQLYLTDIPEGQAVKERNNESLINEW